MSYLHWRQYVDANPRTGPYWLEWYCPPPPLRRSWRALPGQEEWTEPEDGLPVRRVYAIELAPV